MTTHAKGCLCEACTDWRLAKSRAAPEVRELMADARSGDTYVDPVDGTIWIVESVFDWPQGCVQRGPTEAGA